MNDQIPDAPEWNPLASLPDEWRDLEVSGGRAAVLYRRWSGRERLAYEDAMTERLLTLDESGEETLRLGTVRLFGASLTIKGSRGFPTRDGEDREFLTGTRAQVESDLLSITDEETFAEILRHAREVQPLPGQSAAAPDDADADAGEEGSGDADDPSQASSTDPGPTSDDDA